MVLNEIIILEFEKLIEQIKHEIDNSVDKKEKQVNSFRLRQIQNVLNIIKKYPTKIKSGEELKEIKGVGKNSIDRINEILKKGKLKEIKLKKKSKKELEYIENLEKVINIGRQKAIELVRDNNIKSIEELKEAHKSGKIILNDKILLGLKYFDKFKQNIPREEITKTELFLKEELLKIDKELFLIVCGSYRRLKKTSNDIDILITHPKIKTLSQLKNSKINYLVEFVLHLKSIKFLKDDLTDKNYTNKYMGFSKYKKNPIRRIDIRYVPTESYYSALLYFTGSGNFNKKMRELAISLGYKLNEYGLFKIEDDKQIRVKVKSEKEIFYKLGMEYLDPEDRL